jgi:hypothetical protein
MYHISSPLGKNISKLAFDRVRPRMLWCPYALPNPTATWPAINPMPPAPGLMTERMVSCGNREGTVNIAYMKNPPIFAAF